MIDPQLFDLLFQVRRELGTSEPFQVISGYRSPATNSRLRNSRGGGVARHSLHMDGKAIDIRVAGVPLGDLRDAAKTLKGGGVGFYQGEQFVHLDTGRVRYW
ncbi:Peptidase M15 [compost metagenome]